MRWYPPSHSNSTYYFAYVPSTSISNGPYYLRQTIQPFHSRTKCDSQKNEVKQNGIETSQTEPHRSAAVDGKNLAKSELFARGMSKHEGFHLPKRLWVTLSFAMMFLLGVPIWWKSTEIYRAELPYEEIEHWNERKAYDEPFRVMLDLYVPPSWNNENSKSILSNALREYETQSSEALYAIHYQSSLFPMSDLSPLSEYSCDAVHGRIEQMNPTNNGRYAFVSVPVDATQNLPKFTICPTRVVLMRMEKDSNTQESENWLRSVAEIAARKLISSPNTEDKVCCLYLRDIVNLFIFTYSGDVGSEENPV